jgi:hypothetical protein
VLKDGPLSAKIIWKLMNQIHTQTLKVSQLIIVIFQHSVCAKAELEVRHKKKNLDLFF